MQPSRYTNLLQERQRTQSKSYNKMNTKEIKIPDGYEALIEGNKVVLIQKGGEDEKIRTRLIALVEAFGQGKYKDEMLAYLEKQKEQKPAEWNEESDKLLNYAISMTDDAQIKRFLKSLRPQPQSVKEKESYIDGFETARRNTASAFMQYLDENRVDGKMCLSNGECEDINKAFEVGDWAKIIRYVNKYLPHWKPSEEQMKIFNEAIEHYSKYWDSEDIKILCSLYDDLKKL